MSIILCFKVRSVVIYENIIPKIASDFYHTIFSNITCLLLIYNMTWCTRWSTFYTDIPNEKSLILFATSKIAIQKPHIFVFTFEIKISITLLHCILMATTMATRIYTIAPIEDDSGDPKLDEGGMIWRYMYTNGSHNTNNVTNEHHHLRFRQHHVNITVMGVPFATLKMMLNRR